MLVSVLNSSLIIAGISVVMAALISVIDSIVNNYGEVMVDINEGKKELKVNGGSPILHTLAEQEIYLPSACGGRGSCGACKCQVTSDVGPHLPTETPYLTKEEIADNIRLGCQVKVKKDIALKIPEALFNIKKYKGTVTSAVKVTHDILEIKFDLNGEEINFTPGMYMQFEAPPHGKVKTPTQRAYSISSNPADKNMVELLIRLVPDGLVTGYVHENLKVGDEYTLVGPFGEFHKQETDATMICVAGGSGMAPFKSILYDMRDKGINDREIWYFFGAVTKRDIFYVEEMQQLEKEWPCFHFVPALSAPTEEDRWEGPTGLITNVMDEYLSQKVGREKDWEGYLCGSPGMINACINVMTKNKIPESKIYYDKFA